MSRIHPFPSYSDISRPRGVLSRHSWNFLVVDGDERAARELTQRLRRHRHEARSVGTGAEALRRCTDAEVVLLALDLPDVDGLEVCRSIAETSRTPLLALAEHGSELDCVLGLQAGADDFLVKPYGFRELLARVEAVMRRAHPAERPRSSTRLGPLTIDHTTRVVRLHGQPVALTRKEFDLLHLLASPPGKVVHRRHILHHVWQDIDLSRSRTIDTHVNSLRRKLGSAGWIIAVRGVGFRLVEA
ncbi:response regulator transcription factor [Streptomyces zhaozhouensis]|uniref:response regulator transcription factor n=1 Tax=Streptomyces zhaozhouensis TaxID=1300267 RepID=UPI001FE71695|nr:response regulator transcription factor [Streptomyces zhaozhouensis]